jgi:hypothetical protein
MEQASRVAADYAVESPGSCATLIEPPLDLQPPTSLCFGDTYQILTPADDAARNDSNPPVLDSADTDPGESDADILFRSVDELSSTALDLEDADFTESEIAQLLAQDNIPFEIMNGSIDKLSSESEDRCCLLAEYDFSDIY